MHLKLTLRTRILLSMLAIIVVSFLATGISAYVSFLTQNEEYHTQRLQRKEQSVTRSMDYFLEKHEAAISPDSIGTVLYDKVMELADVHNILLVLFDLQGQFLMSSDDELLEQKAIPHDVDYTILKQLSTGNARAVVRKETDSSDFLLTYWYIFDTKGAPMLITCVPYFDTEPINSEELTSFFIQISEVYVVLFIITALLGFLLSNYITKSLKRVAMQMKTIDLRGTNKPIEWEGDDEIGILVSEYNAAISELEQSARLLAVSERESAWREMARQVAHEIKNPLTPMKLRIQHIQKAWDDRVPDFDEKLQKLSDTLIEQIDTLSRIASEFSYFAQMPVAGSEQVHLPSMARAAAALYDGHSSAFIEVVENGQGPFEIMADKDQMLRVFNNLVSNAMQAMPEGTIGKITVIFSRNENQITVEVRDNGKGITEADKPKIFTPNFTTKTTGTGLGLAMVKQIVENMLGAVWFESEVGRGTSFFLRFKNP